MSLLRVIFRRREAQARQTRRKPREPGSRCTAPCCWEGQGPSAGARRPCSPELTVCFFLKGLTQCPWCPNYMSGHHFFGSRPPLFGLVVRSSSFCSRKKVLWWWLGWFYLQRDIPFRQCNETKEMKECVRIRKRDETFFFFCRCGWYGTAELSFNRLNVSCPMKKNRQSLFLGGWEG